jgi:hypothetical protein
MPMSAVFCDLPDPRGLLAASVWGEAAPRWLNRPRSVFDRLVFERPEADAAGAENAGIHQPANFIDPRRRALRRQLKASAQRAVSDSEAVPPADRPIGAVVKQRHGVACEGYRAFMPKLLVVLGIAAGFSGPDGDMKICDVALARRVYLYMHRARNRMDRQGRDPGGALPTRTQQRWARLRRRHRNQR